MRNSHRKHWGLLGVVIGLWACDRDEVVPPPAGPTQAPRGEQTESELLPGDKQLVAARGVEIDRYILAPGDFEGDRVTGTARVGEVISDRGFWLVSGGKRVLAVMYEDPPSDDQRININQGQTLQFEGVAWRRESNNHRIGQLEPATQAALEQQPGFIALHWKDVEILQRPQGSASQGGESGARPD